MLKIGAVLDFKHCTIPSLHLSPASGREGLLALLLLLFFSCPVYASTTALAMHGSPLYPADFKHLDYVNPDAPKGGDMKTSVSGSFDSINNHIILGNHGEGLELLNDKLMERAWNEPFTMYGLVAESIDVAPDRSWIIFHLNPKARFHDGLAMTAEDVKWSYEIYRAHGHPVRRHVYGLVTDVKIISPRDIKFTFGKGYDREAVMILAMMPVLPKHYWIKHDITKTTLDPPLGSGPYKIREVEPGRKIVYERVKDYWAKYLPINVGLYNFDTITYTYYRDDDIALQAFKAGDYNLRHEYNVHKWLTAYDCKALREGRIIKDEIPHRRPEWLRAMIFNTRRPMFQDRHVREALNLMFNFDWLNKNLFLGAEKRITSIFPNSELAATGKPQGEELAELKKYKDQLPPEVFGNAWQPPSDNIRDNERKAIALLKESGWIYKDQDLVNAKTFEPFSFEILLSDPADEKIALEFSRDLKRIGIAARVRTVDSAQFTGRLDAYDYDMVMHRWINSLSPGNEQLNYWGTASAENKGARNYAGIESPAVDALAASITQADDRQTLVAHARALDRALMWGYYMIPMNYLGRDMVAYATDIHRPRTVPIYGIVQEAMWMEPSKNH
jgi:microcin C transport system substrate-binding protein